jgi:hypothetical protein
VKTRSSLGFALILMGAAYADGLPGIEKAWLDPDRQIMVQVGGKAQTIARDPEQVSSSAPVVSPDRRTVGWLAETPGCCTSYPLPMTLMLYRPGEKLLRIGGGGLAIWGWKFRAGSRQVALLTGTTHGGYPPAMHLHDVRTGRLLESWFGGSGKTRPAWAAGLEH